MPVDVGLAALVVVDSVALLDEVAVPEVADEVAVPEVVDEVAVPDVVDVVLDRPESEYTLRREPAPQYWRSGSAGNVRRERGNSRSFTSVLLSAQVIEQSVMAVGTEPAANAFAHQHSPPYSVLSG